MSLYAFEPQNPAEDLDYEIDFTNWLSVDETITGYHVSTLDPQVIVNRSAVSGKSVRFWVTGGNIARMAVIECSIETSKGRTYAVSPRMPFSK